ncbi:exonuclease domain-containing protein [Amycolatopsis taiwanensis]|uniref:exonuclease domain-containing protein n=1 Tax=Amycolatopsis taiwanensis TaxID=342230 RepID=UPI0004BC0C1B|nr:exonuclease domain-containing protein [Amycolatopsis taiwanensis]
MNWHERPFVAFDLETTSVDVETARIVTAAVVTVDPSTGAKDVREWLADPGIDIPAEATAVHGITTEHARQHGEPAADVVWAIAGALTRAWLKTHPVVVYNASYDLSLLDREMRRHGLGELDTAAVIDPLVIDKHYDRFRRGSRKLVDTARHYRIELSEQDAHGAAADALAAARVAWRLARVYPELAGMRLPELHAHQIAWHAEQAASLQEYFRAKGSDEIVPLEWPLRPVAVSLPEPAGGDQ